MLHISTQKLIEKLLERTLTGTIDWKERVPDGVILETEGYIVELTASPAGVRLSQASGRLLEDVTQEILEGTINQAGRNYASIVVELTGEADRFAKGTEQAIASILDAVESSNTPVLKSGPSFLGQPKTEVEQAETEVEAVSSNSDPSTEAGMNAAIVKMVAEINGSPAGEELDALDNATETESAIETEADQETIEVAQEEPVTEIEAETVDEEIELTPLDAEALLAEGLPQEPSIDEKDMVDEKVEEDIPEFKTHIVETPTSGIAAGSMAAAAAAATLAQSTDDAKENTDKITTEEVHASENDDEMSLDTPEDLPDLPDVQEIDELDASAENETKSIELEAESEETTAATKELLPPPPLDLEPTDEARESDELEINIPELEDAIQIEDIKDTPNAEPETDFNKPATDDHFQPFAKKSTEPVEDTAEEDVETSTAFNDDMPPAPKALPLVDEDLVALDIEQQSIELEVETLAAAPEQEPHVAEETILTPKSRPPLVEAKPASPAPLGFTFKNKVTATGLTIGSNIGTLISGVPEDIRQRADDHERMVRLQSEKAQAEERAIKARKAAEDARKSSVGFKSWS